MEQEELELLKRYLTEDGILKQYPSKKTIRMLALAYIAEKFEYGRNYTEKEVNQIIQESHSFHDHELIRRELFMYGFMERLRDGSSYWLSDRAINK